MRQQHWVSVLSLAVVATAGAFGGLPGQNSPAVPGAVRQRLGVPSAAGTRTAHSGRQMPLSLRRALTKELYRVHSDAPGGGIMAAANASQRMSLRFRPQRVEVSLSGPQRKADFRTLAVGRGTRLRPILAGRGTSRENRVEYPHRTPEGIGVTEWWVNAPEGLEQGYVVAAPPSPHQPGETAPLTVALAVDGGLSTQVAADGQTVALRDASGGAVLEGKGLRAWDASGRSLPIRMTAPAQPGSQRLNLEVDDTRAVYPVTIDPVWTQVQKLTQGAGDAAVLAQFGWSVALDGNTALFGAYRDSPVVGGSAVTEAGSAYVFVRSGDTWQLQQKLTAGDAAADDNFGSSVALDGDTAVVGAYGKSRDVSGTLVNRAGAAYIFVRSGNTWSFQQKLEKPAADADDIDHFGQSVAVIGDAAIVGVPYDSPMVGGSERLSSGSAYVYKRTGTTWMQQQILTVPAAEIYISEQFGSSLAVDGTTLVVGGYNAWPVVGGNRYAQAGAAYVFEQSGDSWNYQQTLIAPAARIQDSAHFGYSVAMDSDTLVVGAVTDSVDFGGAGKPQSGSAYVFVRNSGTWEFQAQLSEAAAEAAINELFGESVGVSGNTVAVGAKWEDVGDKVNAGAVYVFERVGTVWTQTQRLTEAPDDARMSEQLGNSLALEGDTLLAGVYAESPEIGGSSVQFAGSVVVFQLRPFTLVAPATATVGQPLTVQWSVPAGQSAQDWVGFYRSDVPGSAGYLNWAFTKGAASGSYTITAPGPGTYVFRYYLNNGSSLQAVSQTVTVSDPPASEFSLSVNTSSLAPGGSFTVNWSAPAGRPIKDWIGLFPKSAPGSTGYVQWFHTGGTRTGSKTLPAPSTAGEYEARMFLQDSNLLAATSGTLTVTAPAAPTVTPTVTSIAAGGTLKVSWTAPAGRPSKDWVALARADQLVAGPPQRVSGYGKWAYTGGTSVGSTNLSLAGVAPGTYYLVYLLNDTTNVGAVSAPITVTP